MSNAPGLTMRSRFVASVAFVASAVLLTATSCGSTGRDGAAGAANATDGGRDHAGTRDSGGPDAPTGAPGPICDGADVFGNACSGVVCHHSGDDRARGLDLQSPGVPDRLVGVASSCNGRPYIDPADPEGGFLLEKLIEDAPECGGSRMPFNGRLTDAQLACVREWIADVAAAKR